MVHPEGRTQSKDGALGLYNSDAVAAVLHAVSAFALALAKDEAVDSSAIVGGYTINPLAFAASAAFWSSLVHNATAILDPTKNHEYAYLRYVDYTVSASLMGVPAAIYSGQRDPIAVGVGTGFMVLAMVVAGVCESLQRKIADKDDKPNLDVEYMTTLFCAAIALVLGLTLEFADSQVDSTYGLVTITLSTASIMVCVYQAASVRTTYLAMAREMDARNNPHPTVVWTAFIVGALLYVAAWVALLSKGEASVAANNFPVTSILVSTHALFIVIFVGRALGETAPCANNPLKDETNYDLASTSLSVFCKILLHWLVFATSAVSTESNNKIFIVFPVACVVSAVVGIAHYVGNSKAKKQEAQGLDSPLLSL